MSPVQNEFPMPANAYPPGAPPQNLTVSPDMAAGKPIQSQVGSHPAVIMPGGVAGALRQFAGQEVFTLDPDLRLALEDMCQAANGARWKEAWPQWLAQMANDALKNFLGQ